MRTRYRWSDKEKRLIPIEEWIDDAPKSAMVMGDIQPYRSMIDGSIITSRSKHRAHLRQHNCVEVGNDSSLKNPYKPPSPPPGLKETIIRAVDEQMMRKR